MASRADATVFGARGFAILYADGTLELFQEGTVAPITFRPQPGGVNAYDYYDQEGIKVEGIIIVLSADRIFGGE